MNRTHTIGPKGASAFPLPPDQTVSDGANSVPRIGESARLPELLYVQPMEEHIRGLLSTAPDDLKIPQLIRSLSIAMLQLQFERNFAVIFGSQLRALHDLNVAHELSKVRLFEIYEEQKALSPELYSGFTFDQWKGFLVSAEFVEDSFDRVTITPKGREFLSYCIVQGKDLIRKPF